MVDRVLVSAEWIGDSLNGSQTAVALRVTAAGRYVMELPTRELRLGDGRHRAVLPNRLVVEIAPPEADILQLARDLLAQEPRWEGRCVFCWQPAEHAPHVDDCIVARARRQLALIDAEAHDRHRRGHPAAGRSAGGQPPRRGGPPSSR